MSPSDRHQIVVLTSAFHGYEGKVTINLGGDFGGALGGGIFPIAAPGLANVSALAFGACPSP